MSVIERPISRTVARLRNLIAATVAPALGGRRTAVASRVALPASAHRAAEPIGAGASAAGGLAAAADVVGAARPLAAAGVTTVAPPPPPDTIVAWLARAALLYGVPFEYITPDGRMLPRESLRFFYIDANWQNSLVDGAVSVGLSSSADRNQFRPV